MRILQIVVTILLGALIGGTGDERSSISLSGPAFVAAEFLLLVLIVSVWAIPHLLGRLMAEAQQADQCRIRVGDRCGPYPSVIRPAVPSPVAQRFPPDMLLSLH